MAEIADEIGVSAQVLGPMLAAHDRMLALESDPDWNRIPGEAPFEDWVLCLDMIRSLPQPCAQVLWLRCVLGRSQAETALRLGVSQPCVSRLEKQAKERLKQSLTE